MPWYYNQRTGQLRAPDGTVHQQRGYSGFPGYVNDGDSEHIRNRGPAPRGNWRVGRVTAAKGEITLESQPNGHDAHGRTDIWIHGDNRDVSRTASQGCIVLNRQMREAIRDSSDWDISVLNEPEW